MALPTTREQINQTCDVSAKCPYCGDRVAIIPLVDPFNHSGHAYFMGLCPNYCRKGCGPVFAVYEELNGYITQIYPSPNDDASRIHQSIPSVIREDYAEAMRCSYVNAYKSCVVMCRRVIEAIACDKLGGEAKREGDGATKRLGKLIELLHDNRFITTDIRDTADAIKYFGDYGAHVQDDGLDSVSRDDAEVIIKLTRQLLNAIYIAPYETKKLRDKSRSDT